MDKLLTLILALTGLLIALIGFNTAYGGMTTLGWQFSPDFLEITDVEGFRRHDNNARFFAGVFVGLGLITAASAFLNHLRIPAAWMLSTFPLGGIFRLLQPGHNALGDPAHWGSLAAELILIPILILWIFKFSASKDD